MHNVEFKCELRDPNLARAIISRRGATFIGTLEQTDTYYKIPSGRLKKREQTGEPVEYIFYDRENRTRPKLSHFHIYSEHEALERFGTQPLPIWVVVKKRRDLFLIGNVRLHVDQVEGLGFFLELEAMVSTSNNVARCHQSIADLRQALQPVLGEPIAVGYSDLLAQELEPQTPTR
jgi:adenylate cyclase class 2